MANKQPSEGYQGWTNHATWCVALWLGNVEGWYRTTQELTQAAIKDAPACRQVREGVWSEQEAARITLEDTLKATVEEILLPEDDHAKGRDGDARGFRRDMLRGYFDDVDWNEIAENYLSDEDAYSALPSVPRGQAV